ncbi:Pre-mRNA-processing factor 6/Prp1 [Corchorus olitorius]|uniref:Pre-mRNA-processing factor 6/Prp1 n=1 Tax=Corchorus olitorius TaxID=93759 RepID=A0A1R3IIN1_9ROSI|nr:Pre-mRNA-processing factor 6/Prp1 [Corchorus olitorius]
MGLNISILRQAAPACPISIVCLENPRGSRDSCNPLLSSVRDHGSRGSKTPQTEGGIGYGRKKKLSGLTASVDPETYLKDLAGIKNRTDEEISNIKQARMVLEAVTRRNPRVASGWISLARLKELTRKMEAARRLIEKGC